MLSLALLDSGTERGPPPTRKHYLQGHPHGFYKTISQLATSLDTKHKVSGPSSMMGSHSGPWRGWEKSGQITGTKRSGKGSRPDIKANPLGFFSNSLSKFTLSTVSYRLASSGIKGENRKKSSWYVLSLKPPNKYQSYILDRPMSILCYSLKEIS